MIGLIVKAYLVKHNETDERFTCIASDYEDLKNKCKEHYGDSDIMIIKTWDTF